MNILVYFGHPSQYLFLRQTIKTLTTKGHNTDILIKSKDILENLIINDGFKYHNILPKERKNNKFSIFWSMLKRDFRLYKFVRKKHYDLFIGTDPSLAHIGFLKKVSIITTLEDDSDVIPMIVKTTYPFTSTILTPEVCNVGKYTYKKTGYNGYMKLSYLHPSIFVPDFNKINTVINSPYVLIRLSKLNAHHDFGISGLNSSLLKSIIAKVETTGRKIIISSEAEIIDPNLKCYTKKINPSDMHHYLYYADMLISDSQSMSVEAAMLGTPSIRYNDFAGKISVLEELESKYALTFGIKTSEQNKLFNKIDELFLILNLKEEFQRRRKKMLADKIDVTAFMIWFIENYPESKNIMKENPNYQYNL
jgi:uncharacterized protein